MYTTSTNRQIERQLDREEVGTDRQMYTTSNNRAIERQLHREEGEEVGTDRCIQLWDQAEKACQVRSNMETRLLSWVPEFMNNRQRDSQIERMEEEEV